MDKCAKCNKQLNQHETIRLHWKDGVKRYYHIGCREIEPVKDLITKDEKSIQAFMNKVSKR